MVASHEHSCSTVPMFVDLQGHRSFLFLFLFGLVLLALDDVGLMKLLRMVDAQVQA